MKAVMSASRVGPRTLSYGIGVTAATSPGSTQSETRSEIAT